jgi:hypothetical protein
MLGPAKPRLLDQTIAASLEDLIPRDQLYRHIEATLDLTIIVSRYAICMASGAARPAPVVGDGTATVAIPAFDQLVQLPATQVWPAPQTVKQAPQLLPSACRSAHWSQQAWPMGQHTGPHLARFAWQRH